MGKTHFWAKKNNTNIDRIRIVVEDYSRRMIEEWIINVGDHVTATKVLNILKRKYNFPADVKEDLDDLAWLKSTKRFD